MDNKTNISSIDSIQAILLLVLLIAVGTAIGIYTANKLV